MKTIKLDKLMNLATVVGFIGIGLFICYGFSTGIFQSQAEFNNFILKCGVWGPVVLTVFQAVQVVVPILPGSIGCVVSVLAFGPVLGFIVNYIGICAGSVWAFLLAKRYGQAFVRKITKPATYEKYSNWLNKGKKYDIFFAAAIFFPVAPDDFLCFLSGLTDMSCKKFTLIILTCKPFALFIYSMGLTAAVNWILSLF